MNGLLIVVSVNGMNKHIFNILKKYTLQL